MANIYMHRNKNMAKPARFFFSLACMYNHGGRHHHYPVNKLEVICPPIDHHMWNLLPGETVQSDTADQFKNGHRKVKKESQSYTWFHN